MKKSSIDFMPINDFTIRTLNLKIIGQEKREDTEYFQINVSDNFHKIKWELQKTQYDFSILNTKLSKLFYNIPSLPSNELLNNFSKKATSKKINIYQNFLNFLFFYNE